MSNSNATADQPPGFKAPLTEYRLKKSLQRAHVLIAIVGCSVGVGLIGYGIWRWFFGLQNYGPAVIGTWAWPWILAGGVFLIPGLAAAIWLLRWSRLLVRTYPVGIHYQWGWREMRIRWEEISRIQTKVVHYGFLGVAMGENTSLSLGLKDLKTIRFTQRLEGLPDLIETTKGYVYPLLLADYTNHIQQGDTIQFGRLKLGLENLQYRKKTWPWSKVLQVELSRGRLALRVEVKDRLKKIRISAHTIPNIEIVMQLIEYLRRRV